MSVQTHGIIRGDDGTRPGYMLGERDEKRKGRRKVDDGDISVKSGEGDDLRLREGCHRPGEHNGGVEKEQEKELTIVRFKR